MSKKLVRKFILSVSDSVEDGILFGGFEFRNESREGNELIVKELLF